MAWLYWVVWYAYVGITVIFAIGILRSWFKSKQLERNSKGKEDEPFVSVIVTFHNEEAYVKRIVSALLHQSYRHYELIFVDDGSTDNTWHILQAYKKWGNVILHQVKEVPAGVSSRKWAVHQGVLRARGEWILTTDADCHPLPRWIESMVQVAGSGQGDLIIGYSPLSGNKSLFHAWIQFENNLTAYLYYSFLGLGIPFMGVGRNLGFRKEWYFKTNPYRNHWENLSGSDDFLVQGGRVGRVLPCLVPSSFVPYHLRAGERLKTYLQRRKRHFSAFFDYSWKKKIALLIPYFIDWFFLFISFFHWYESLVGLFFRSLLFWLAVFGIFGKRYAPYWWLYPLFYLVWLPYHAILNFFLWRNKKENW